MSKKERCSKLLALAEGQRELMFAAERYIWAHPETGYREWETQKYLIAEFEKLGYDVTRAGNIPGFYTDIETGRPGPKLLIMGEMDSLIVNNHPECDPKTGYVHACGHNAQSAALLGLAAALRQPDALHGLSGSIRLMAVPAEELIEIGFREALRKDGIIGYYGGKVELMRRGFMDGCGLAFMVHTDGKMEGMYHIEDGSNGCVVKSTNFLGVSAHAGGAPHNGVNALYAATLAIQAANALRETFRDNEHIRFHPIITRGGGAVNAIPHDVMMESYVRGTDMDAIIRENRKINRAFAASAAAIGANVNLCDRPGYMPLDNNKAMAKIAVEAVRGAMGEGVIHTGGWMAGCTDMGDISQVMPSLHPTCTGAAGAGHGSDYRIEDPESALVGSCKLQLLLLDALLENGAARARQVIAESRPRYTKEEYFKTVDSMFLDKTAVTYNEDGTIELGLEG